MGHPLDDPDCDSPSRRNPTATRPSKEQVENPEGTRRPSVEGNRES